MVKKNKRIVTAPNNVVKVKSRLEAKPSPDLVPIPVENVPTEEQAERIQANILPDTEEVVLPEPVQEDEDEDEEQADQPADDQPRGV